MPEPEAWRLSELHSEDGQLRGLVRKRAPLEPNGRDLRAWFTLTYEPGPTYLPSSDDMRRMAAFEEKLAEQIEAPGHGVLVAVVIVEGKRDHLFYFQDRDEFLRHLMPLIKEVQDYNPQLEVAPDRNWNEFHEMIG